MDRYRRCKNCLFYDDNAEGEHAVCRRNPPPFPKIETTDWCGEFRDDFEIRRRFLDEKSCSVDGRVIE
jgi:hypothetical protein